MSTPSRVQTSVLRFFGFALQCAALAGSNTAKQPNYVPHYHISHPGGPSVPADPNAAFMLDGIWHLHYINRHSYRMSQSYSFIHLTSKVTES